MTKKRGGKMERMLVLSSCLALFLSLLILFSVGPADATDPPGSLCLIVVSGSEGYSSTEIGKATSFYHHMLDTCDEEEIVYLTDPMDPDSDGSATVSDIEDAFEWLEENSQGSTEVVIYISDHEKWIMSEAFFSFDDGNISADSIDSWIDQIPCTEMTLILNGERSGLAGPDLASPYRDIICSMGSDEEFDPDLFNITRSLEDPTADTNNDYIVSFVEAYWKEVDHLSETGQDPELYYP